MALYIYFEARSKTGKVKKIGEWVKFHELFDWGSCRYQQVGGAYPDDFRLAITADLLADLEHEAEAFRFDCRDENAREWKRVRPLLRRYYQTHAVTLVGSA